MKMLFLAVSVASLALTAAAQTSDAPTELLLRTRDVVSEQPQTGSAAIDELNDKYGVTSFDRLIPQGGGKGNPELFVELGLDRTYVVELSGEITDVDGVAAEYQALAEVVTAEANGRWHIGATPNDPLYGSQYGFAITRCSNAWDILTDTRGTIVGVLDTGLDLNHADLRDNRWTNSDEIANNGIDDDNNGYVDDRRGWDFVNNDRSPDDDNGHGTHVSGTVGAHSDNGTMVAGMCWRADIMTLKVCDGGGGCSWSDVAEGIIYAADNECSVTNMSIGGGFSSTIANAVSYAAGNDVSQIAAAGNAGSENETYPAALSQVIAVIATDSSDQRAGFSNHGDWCDVAAPGDDILSTWNNGGTATLDGTSMASPHVAGLATLMRAANPDLNWRRIRALLRYSVDDLGPDGFDNDYGYGRINAGRAVRMAVSLTADSTTVADGSSVNLHAKWPNSSNDTYVLLASTSGFNPGFQLDIFFAGDVRYVPVNIDPFFTLYGLQPGNGVFNNFVGTMDANGEATATFTVPNNLLIGENFDFSGVTFANTDFSSVKRILGTVRINVVD